MPSHSETPSLKSQVGFMMLSLLIYMVFSFDAFRDALADGMLRGNDDYMRLAQVRDWMAGAGWYDIHQARLGDAGVDMHWSRLVDLFIAGIIRLAEPFAGPELAERIAIALWPTLLFCAAALLLMAMARLLHPAPPLPFVALLIGVSYSAFHQFRPGRIDHHNVQIVLMLAAIYASMLPRPRLGGLLAGLACAVSIAIGLETLMTIGIVGGLHALRWACGEDSRGERFAAFGQSFALSLSLAFLISVPPAKYGLLACDAISTTYLLVGVVAGAGAWLCAAVSARLQGVGPRLALALGVGATCIAALALVNPVCLGGPLAQMSAEARELWLPLISEAQPLHKRLRGYPDEALVYVAFPLAALAIAFWAGRKSAAGQRWTLAMLALPIALGFALSFVQVRAAQMNGLLVLPVFAVAMPLARDFLNSLDWLKQPGVQKAVSGAMLAVSMVAVAVSLLQGQTKSGVAGATTAQATSPADPKSETCKSDAVIERLAGLSAARVLGWQDLTGRIVAQTPHVAIAGPYHRSDKAVLDGLAFLTHDETEFAALAAARRADYVVFCLGPGALALAAQRGGDSLTEQIARDGPPDWLRPVMNNKGAWLFEVVGG